MEKKDIKYNCVKEIAKISENGDFSKRITIGNWGKGDNKVDIRTWKPFVKGNPPTAGKGISISYEELSAVLDGKMLEKALEELAAVPENKPKEE